MQLGIHGLIILAFAWFAAKKARAPASDEPTYFPQNVEVIPGKLKIGIFLNDVEYGTSKIPCWTFVSNGLISQNQKEISITLQRPQSVRPEDYPREILDLYVSFFEFAQQGKTVDVGDVTLFSKSLTLNVGDFGGLGYSKSSSFIGVEMPSVPALAGLLLKLDEAQIAWECGLTRILALLGFQYRYYPYPKWSNLRRGPVATMQQMQNSALRGAARIAIPGSFYEDHNYVHLSLSSAGAPKMAKFLNEIPPDTGLALRLQPDPRANACFVWSPTLPQPAAITPDGSDASRKTGNFFAFGADEEIRDLRQVEDGYVALISRGAYEKIIKALKSGADVTVAEGSLVITIEWRKPTPYTSRVTGETIISDNWHEYKPQVPTTKTHVAVDSSKIVLLTREEDVEVRANIDALGAFLNGIENLVDFFFAAPERRRQREVAIYIELQPTGTNIRTKAEPELSPELEYQLEELLGGSDVPNVRGSVKLEYLFSLWRTTIRN